MPVIKSAQKKLRQDKKRTRDNQRLHTAYQSAIKAVEEKPSKKTIARAQSIIDKAAKHNVIHDNKAARLKRQVARHAQS